MLQLHACVNVLTFCPELHYRTVYTCKERIKVTIRAMSDKNAHIHIETYINITTHTHLKYIWVILIYIYILIPVYILVYW